MRDSDDPVLERVAGAGRRLGAVGQHPHRAVGRAGEVRGVQVEVPAAGHGQAVTRPQEARVGEDEGRRQQPVAQQALPAVEVGEDQVEEARALRQAGLEFSPRSGADQQRHEVELPRPVHAARVAVDVVGDAVLADGLPRRFAARRHLGGPERLEARRRRPAPCGRTTPRADTISSKARPGRAT